tara:strand:- start:460 stop:1119 length:660 start_codon:yes stop_codon:yes gene_type:complete
MREDLEQQEQMQNLKAFWKANGKWITSILSLVFIIVASVNGWKLWNNYKKEKASNILNSVEKQIEAQNLDVALRLYTEISDDYSDTLQSGLAGLLVAKALVSDGQSDQAASILKGLTGNSQVKWLAIIRLSSIFLDLNRPGEVVKIIPENIPEHWVGIILDRRGDAFATMGNFDSAKKDWSKALDYYNQNGGNQDVTRFISRKLATIEASLNELEVKKD